MRTFIFCILAATLVSVSSCRSELEKRITGYWSIDEIDFYGESIYKSLHINTFTLSNGGSCQIPSIEWDEPGSDQTQGVWKIVGEDSIHVKTTNPIFGGSYKFVFEKDYENKLLYVVLENDAVLIRARKGMWNFDADKNWGDL